MNDLVDRPAPRSLNVVAIVARSTLRQVLGRRGIAFWGIAAACGVGAALVAGSLDLDTPEVAAEILLELVLPVLVVISVLTGAARSVADGSTHVWTNTPVPRVAVATGIATSHLAVGLGTGLLLGVIAGAAHSDVLATALGGAWGGLLYAALAVALVGLTRQVALTAVLYILVLEGLLTSFAPGMALLSVGAGMRAVIDHLGGSPDSDLGAGAALVQAVILLAGAVALLTARLRRASPHRTD